MPEGSQPSPEVPPDHNSDEDLVAYLDGELDDFESRAVESKLTTDEAARNKADVLKKTFDLLDYLPKSEPSPNFASRTLTHVNPILGSPESKPSSSSTAAHTTLPPPHLGTTGISVPVVPSSRAGWTVFAWSLALSVAGLCGYFGHLLARPHLEASDPAKRTSEQVRLLERLPFYLGVDDFEFLVQLDQPEYFQDQDPTEPANKPMTDTLTSAELEQLETIFKQYSPARQQQLRKLDEELSRQDVARQSRLLGLLEHYAIWLDRLPDGYRKEILTAPAPIERLEAVRLVKSRLWRESLPSVVRERIQQAEGAARDQLVADRKQQDAKQKYMWERAKQEWGNLRASRQPWPFDSEEMRKKVEEYVDKTLKPRMSNVERIEFETYRKEQTASRNYLEWFLYGDAVARLADLHRTLPEPTNGKTIRFAADLPQLFVRELARKADTNRKQLNTLPSHGKWPDFAEAVFTEAHQAKVPLNFSLGPNKLEEYSPAVRAFVETDLAQKVSAKEREELHNLESGQWPDHTKKMLEFAKKYDLSVPGVNPPGPPSKWDHVYRNRPGKK